MSSDEPKGFSPTELRQIKAAAAKMEEQKAAWGEDKLVVFEELLRLPSFIQWAKDNIIINREVSHINKEILITVIYKGGHPDNKTSLEKLAEIDAVITGPDEPETRLMQIKEILDYEVENQEPAEEEKKDGAVN